MKILKFNSFQGTPLQEKSIGSQAIRDKFYSDLDKRTFYTIINIDPTSVRKANFSKPGKYSRWLLIQFQKLLDRIQSEEGGWDESSAKGDESKTPSMEGASKKSLEKKALSEFIKLKERLNFYLYIFSTNWYKSVVKERVLIFGDAVRYMGDILKFKTLDEFIEGIEFYEKRFINETQKAKFDVVYADNDVKILVPLNFTSAAETAKNTDWCTTKLPNYEMWNNWSLMFRILPLKSNYDRVKITWMRGDTKDPLYKKRWFIASSKYPEMGGDEGTPFDIVDGEESWLKVWNFYNDEFFSEESIKRDEEKGGVNRSEMFERKRLFERWKKYANEIKKTMSILSPEAKKSILKYYEKFGGKK